MHGLTLLVLAAGLGRRYGGSKLLEPVGPVGETILDYSLFDARQAGFGRVIFVIRRDMDQATRDSMSSHLASRFIVEHVFQDLVRIPFGFRVPEGRVQPWGTTHAVLSAAAILKEPFAVINVDDFYGAEAYRALAHHLQTASTDHALVGFTLRNTLPEYGAVARGICQVDAHSYVSSIVECKNVERDGGHATCTADDGTAVRLTGDEVTSMNMWGFAPPIFAPMADSFQAFLERKGTDNTAECVLPETVDELIRAGKVRVKALRCADSWFGVTYREDHPRAVQSIRHLIDSGHYPRRLWG